MQLISQRHSSPFYINPRRIQVKTWRMHSWGKFILWLERWTFVWHISRSQDDFSGKLNFLQLQARISKENHILEIGCGWGSLALEVVKRTGCKYTSITLSEEQLQYAELKVKEAGLQVCCLLLIKNLCSDFWACQMSFHLFVL